MSDQGIPLPEWDRRRYDPPHSVSTLRAWARDGKIHPKPEKVGREYRVAEDAVYVPNARKSTICPIAVLQSEDIIVNDIISGKTQKRRQA